MSKTSRFSSVPRPLRLPACRYNNSVATFTDQNNKNPNDGFLVRMRWTTEQSGCGRFGA